MKVVIKKEKLEKEMQAMLNCGGRLTGSRGHRQYVEYIKSRLREMGLEYYVDPFFFRRWESTGYSLSLLDRDKETPVFVSSAHPYSGETPAAGIVEELVLVQPMMQNIRDTKGKIAVIEYKNLDILPAAFAFDKRSAYPEDLKLPGKYAGPVTTTFVKNYYGKLCKKAGAKAAVFAWQNINDDMVEGQYLPFVLDYQGVPILWVNETNGRKVIAAARNHQKARFTLTANIEPNACAETVYCILKGRRPDECVIINTHTDGSNCVEENGPPALLAMLEELKGQKLERNHLFLFTAGHFRLPEFAEKATGGAQASSRWLHMHRALWDGKNGHIKAVCTLTLEHLGCLEWAVVDGKYQYTGQLQPELVYTGNQFVNDLYIEEVKQNRSRVRTMTLRGHNNMHFGEGQNFCQMGIPDIALCTAPDYLCVESPEQELEKFDLNVMVEQTQTFANLAVKLENIPTERIGKAEPFSILTSHDPAGGTDWTMDGLIKKLKNRAHR